MNNKELVEYKENFITKIRNFFKKLFSKNVLQKNNIQEKFKEINNSKELLKDVEIIKNQEQFMKEMKIEKQFLYDSLGKKEFLKKIDGNAEALNMLSLDRLKKLEEYYDSCIEEYENIIKKLKSA